MPTALSRCVSGAEARIPSTDDDDVGILLGNRTAAVAHYDHLTLLDLLCTIVYRT